MSFSALLIIGVILAVGLIAAELYWNSWRSGKAFCSPLPSLYQSRSNQKDVWRRDYEGKSAETADAVLTLLCESFIFNPESRYQFLPDDRIADIYQEIYPRWKTWFSGDCMEFELFGLGLEERFGFDASQWRPDITIGEIVDSIK